MRWNFSYCELFIGRTFTRKFHLKRAAFSAPGIEIFAAIAAAELRVFLCESIYSDFCITYGRYVQRYLIKSRLVGGNFCRQFETVCNHSYHGHGSWREWSRGHKTVIQKADQNVQIVCESFCATRKIYIGQKCETHRRYRIQGLGAEEYLFQ